MHKLSLRQNQRKKREIMVEYKPAPNCTTQHLESALQVLSDFDISTGHSGVKQSLPPSFYKLDGLISEFRLNIREWDGGYVRL